jgi:mono/diheme cytochrome c family protein
MKSVLSVVALDSRLRSATWVVLALVATAAAAATVAAAEPVDFEKQVWPILETSCVSCHGTKEQFSNLRLDSPAAILKGGDLGKVVVAGEPEKSPLYVRTSLPDDDLDLMPVEGERLNEEQVDVLKRWIAEGASFGDWTGP